MKKKITISCFAIAAVFQMIFIPAKIYALNYTISFTGTGASTSVGSVVVQNLTKGTTVTVPTDNVLILSDVPTSIEKVTEMTNEISIFPNPIQAKSTVRFFAKQAGSTQINIFSIDGKKLIGNNKVFNQGENSFQLSVPNGIYTLQVQGNGFNYNAKLFSRLNSETMSQIFFKSNDNQLTIKQQKNKSAETTMLYNSGDQLLYKGISGNYCTIVTDKPTDSKITNFEFVECKDADNNYYSVVTIGTQTWMAENLKTTKYRNDYQIATTTTKVVANTATSCYQWPYLDIESNANTFGRLYTWWAITNTDNLAPVGWHVSTDAEWTTLQNYLTLNGYNYDNTTTGNKITKSLAANSDWQVSGYTGVPGFNLTKNNKSGFSALPGGNRNDGGGYQYLLSNGTWWTVTPGTTLNAYRRNIDYSNAAIGRDLSVRTYGFSVRCVKD